MNQIKVKTFTNHGQTGVEIIRRSHMKNEHNMFVRGGVPTMQAVHPIVQAMKLLVKNIIAAMV